MTTALDLTADTSTSTEPTPGRLDSVPACVRYVLGDWDRPSGTWVAKKITLVSQATGVRYTYRVSRPPGESVERAWLVGVLTGSDNQRDYTYMGLLRPTVTDGKISGVYLNRTAKSGIAADAPSWVAFAFFTRRVLREGVLPSRLEVWHSGRCGRCSRLLTDPASVARGLGPKCASRLGI